MEEEVTGKKVTSCTTVLVALFQKHRCAQTFKSKDCKCCSCACHSKKDNNKNSANLSEMNYNKFFNCKCNQDCEIRYQCKKCEKNKSKRRRRSGKNKIVKFEIEHTGSMNSLGSPFRKSICTCDALQNPLPCCKLPPVNPRLNTLGGANQYSLHCSNIFYLLESHDNKCIDIIDEKDKCEKSTKIRRPKSFYEWTIPFENIELGELEATSPEGPVYRGRWHGDVMVYMRSHATAQRIEDFNNEVALLGLIRHENVVLFMGACIQTPNLAIITSVRKGHTLYTHLHVRQTAFHFGSKFSISKQIAQGMGYLHAKGITLGKLCSRNIFLESKVKIAITDYTMVDQPSVKTDYGCIPKGHLTYLSPELMRTLHKDGIYLSCTKRMTQESDIFAYGTILYELFCGQYPFHGALPEIIVWKVCNRHVQMLNDSDFPLIFKGLIQSCWLHDPACRPEFQEILRSMRRLNIPRSLQQKLSLSDSGAINRQQHAHSSFYSRLDTSPAQNVRWKKPSV